MRVLLSKYFKVGNSYGTELMAHVMTNSIPTMMNGNKMTTVMSAICLPFLSKRISSYPSIVCLERKLTDVNEAVVNGW